ncbi:MAG: HEPN domain-containing protein [Aigarchaeota archaeon]|nr:HEPN domain-containing protein [Candidatus Pelearchaeum maunauluense]
MERATDLLADAEDFLGAAQDLLATGRWSKVCFNAQQAAELALTAVLHKLGIERRGHALTELLDEISRNLSEVERFKDHARLLDQYYIPTRYANAFASGPAKDKYTKAQAEEALRISSEILDWARKIVLQG